MRTRFFSLLLVASVCVGCGSSTGKSRSTGATTPPTSGAAHPSSTTTSPGPASGTTCGQAAAPTPRYASVVVFAFENRKWSDVGPGFGPSMPYLHELGTECAYFPDWTETDTHQNSLTQYIGQVTGARQPGTVNDCNPSSSCSTTADNIFRQARSAGLRAVNYVEGATKPCSSSGNAVRHVPYLYLWAPDDRAHCNDQVRPLTEFDPDHPPAFAFVTPNTCDDGHDCGDSTVDAWARAHVQPVLDSAAYKAGRVAVFVWYDEDHPVPNLWITRTAARGPITLSGAGYAATLKAWESMLGLPCLSNACDATDMRVAAHS